MQLLLKHTDDTFVTPVFNGSASQRNAAGQMIEEVTKAVRRGRTVDDAFLNKLETDMISLYRLDQFDTVSVGREDLGPLPPTAVALLSALGAAWLAIAVAFILGKRKAKK